MWVGSYVNGVEISLTSLLMNQLLGLDDKGFKVSWLGTVDIIEIGKLRDEAVAFLFEGKGEKVLNAMTMTARTIGSMVTAFIQCRNGREMTPFNPILIYNIMKRYKIDFGNLLMHNLRLTLENPCRKLPYSLMITHILRALNISTRCEIIVQIK